MSSRTLTVKTQGIGIRQYELAIEWAIEMETEFGIRQYKHTGICTILGGRDKDTTVSSASSLCEGEKIVCKISLTGSLWKLLCATPLQGYQDICRMSCARDPVYIGSVRRGLKNVTA